jgi:hypothetical protein
MKKLLFSTAIMLFCLSSYSQKLYVRNDTPYTLTVSAVEGDLPNCNDGSGTIASIAPGGVDWITTNDYDYDWTVIRAQDIPSGLGSPQYFLVHNSTCSSSCEAEVTTGLDASWNGCYEVTIIDI